MKIVGVIMLHGIINKYKIRGTFLTKRACSDFFNSQEASYV